MKCLAPSRLCGAKLITGTLYWHSIVLNAGSGEQGLENECILINKHPCSDLSAGGNELLPGSSDTDGLNTPELDLETCKSSTLQRKRTLLV